MLSNGKLAYRLRSTARTVPSAVQVGLAAAGAWWLAVALLGSDQPLYAPIGAVVAIGAGDNRLVNRPMRLLAGMAVAVAVAGTAVNWIGTGVWQLLVITAITTLAGRLLFDDPLARSYAAFHGAVVGVTGSTGIIPAPLVEAAIGSATALVVVHLVFPPRLERAVFDRPQRAASAARRAFQSTALALRTRDDFHMDRAREAAHDVRYLVADDGRLAFARQLAFFSPFRRPNRDTTERMIESERELTALLDEVPETIRSVDRLISGDDRARPELAEVLENLDLMVAAATDGERARSLHPRDMSLDVPIDGPDEESTTAAAVVDQVRRISEGLAQLVED